MKSFITSIKSLFALETDNENLQLNFSGIKEKRRLVIPVYQREYKWESKQIETLIKDIVERDKFLGVIILDEKSPNYEIVDGQQRITTLYLIIIALYNLYIDNPRDQTTIERILKPYEDTFILVNDSIGSYIDQNEGRYYINIDSSSDVYNQKTAFETALITIQGKLENLIGEDTHMIRSVLDKLLDCEVLVLINDRERRRHNPIERLFLDINEKGKHLDAEDVFKGYCFQIFDSTDHDHLKELWVDFKKEAMPVSKNILKKDVNVFLFRYIQLLDDNNKSYTQELKAPKTGVHFLEGKTQTFVEELLCNMTLYSRFLNNFIENIRSSRYHYIDICNDSYEHRADHNDHDILDIMCEEILTKGDQIPKFPFMYLLYYLSVNSELAQELKHDQLMRITTNFYVYAKLFDLANIKKEHKIIDRNIINALRDSQKSTSEIIQTIITKSKELRKTMVDSFSLSESLGLDDADFIYSVIDNLSLDGSRQTPRFGCIYPDGGQFNHEHFIINDNNIIEWCKSGEKRGKRIKIIDIKRDYSVLKKRFSNYLVLDHNLNGELESRDIIWKIEHIYEWYRETLLPEHVRVFIEHISSLESYRILKEYKNGFDWEDIDNQLEELKLVYAQFLDEFFGEKSTRELFDKLKGSFDSAFARQTTS